MTDDDLFDALTEIQGVGDATAEKIMGVLADHSAERDPYLDRAIQAAADGNDRAAAVYLRRID